MKSEESPSPMKHGDISLINGSISNLAEDGKLSSSKSPRKTEPSSETLPNCVTPAQLVHVTFPADGRYQPVRAISVKTPSSFKNSKATVAPAGSKSATAALGPASEKYAGASGILILVDRFPAEDEEFVEFEAPAIEPVPEEVLPNESIPNGHATTSPESGLHIGRGRAWGGSSRVIWGMLGGFIFLVLSSVADQYCSILSITTIKVWVKLYNRITLKFSLHPFTQLPVTMRQVCLCNGNWLSGILSITTIKAWVKLYNCIALNFSLHPFTQLPVTMRQVCLCNGNWLHYLGELATWCNPVVPMV